MFDFAWSEILLIGAVALIAIGPKDMPAAIRTVSTMIKKARRMAAEFQTHIDEMVREADLGDVRKTFNEIRNFDVAGAVERHVDPDRSLRNTFQDDPFKSTPATAASPPESEVSTLEEVTVGDVRGQATPIPDSVSDSPAEAQADAARADVPAYIPPQMIPPVPAVARPMDAPAWIPPAAARSRHH
jgi:sec-independent protein translocase protein TatB